MLAFSIAWRQCRSLWSSGEIRVLLFALILAVTATTSVSFFTDRIKASMQTQGNVLLGADLVVNSDHVLPEKYLAEAQRRQYQTTQALEFSSMVLKDDSSELAEIKAVEAGFPLRGHLTISRQSAVTAKAEPPATDIPAPGTVWMEPRLAQKLALKIGDEISVGDSQFMVAAFVLQEPSRGGDMFSIAPRLFMNSADVPATGLVQFGSRVKYQLLVAAHTDGAAVNQAMEDYAEWLKPQLARGERVDDIRSARPEMRSALNKAQQFLGIASMVGVILAMVAMLLASIPYVQKSLDAYALMRCFGATKKLITQILLYQTLLLALVGSVIGCVLGFAAQYGLAILAGRLFLETLPAPGWMPVVLGFATGFATLLTVVWPQLQRLRAVPALRILRQDLEGNVRSHGLMFLPALLVLAGLVFWHAGDIKLAGIVFSALFGLVVVAGLLAYAGMRFVQTFSVRDFGVIKLGFMGLRRRPMLTIAQVVGLSMGLMAILLLAFVRNDLLKNWQTSLPADAPNRFVINIQADQIPGINALLSTHAIQHADIFPMVRARLISVNGKPIKIEDYKDDRAKRLAEREFNLSWAAEMQADNELVAGQWWSAEDAGKPYLSLEQGLAETLNLKLGDKLSYDVAGTQLELTITSVRKVEWNSMHVNFFAVTPPQVLDNYAANYLTSFHLPAGKEDALNQLVKTFPNLTIINVAAVLEQIQSLISKMSYAIEFVFGFSLLAGLAVLYAALMATREERVRESTLMRVLGASRKQVVLAMLVEFLCIGLLASIVATIFTNIAAYALATRVLEMDYQFNAWLTMQALLAAMVLVPLSAWLVARHQFNQPPRALLQSV
ncbi:FtsX-like permease family protein [Methylophilus sp. VKM B-3414]|uniref:ABC transporter permease n=1 Tax=Methylophilus sp. VKM B-3414 TaxID=3076121 RepID=UPI0028C7FB7B|nr:FtsX-like permease family protein [Methylophilus sp. VKM B-3414]MDT7848549.1 FtsX-like permease family protein [Methylophilus sp. VKM B-3414]